MYLHPKDLLVIQLKHWLSVLSRFGRDQNHNFFLLLFRVCPRVLGGLSAAFNSEAGGSVTEEEKRAKPQHFKTDVY